MLTTTIIRRKRAKILMHNIRIKSISKNIKKKRAKISRLREDNKRTNTIKRNLQIKHKDYKIL